MFDKRVLVAMSGGLDSSIAAIMLQQQGYELIGITMKTWEYSPEHAGVESGCCNLDSINDAREVAVSLDFPHYVLDLREEFNDYIVSDFVSQYMKGRTPNPCVLCNTYIKWDALLKRADELKCKYIATGHYAQLRKENNRYVLSKGIDDNKDQSYVLWGLKQGQLERTLFPLGKFTKDKIRELAEKYGFKSLAKKRESYEICFIPDDNYRGFLKAKLPDIEEKLDGGNFVDINGKILGKHKGYPFYTIGQRKGLNIALGKPMYVKEIHADTNTIILGEKEDILSDSFFISGFNSIKYESVNENTHALLKVRYKDPGTKGVLYPKTNNNIEVKLNEPVAAVTPGQSAVAYDGNDVIGGGFIEKT